MSCLTAKRATDDVDSTPGESCLLKLGALRSGWADDLPRRLWSRLFGESPLVMGRRVGRQAQTTASEVSMKDQ